VSEGVEVNLFTREEIDALREECWAQEDMRPPLDTFKTA
jgi:hypothetical protein